MVLACQNIDKAFGEHVILNKVNFHIEEHEKTALVGINGAGKSTLFKIIMKELEPDDGQIQMKKVQRSAIFPSSPTTMPA